MIKAIFFDIDGTLFSHTLKLMPKSTKRAIAQLQERGILCFIASGRHRTDFRHMVGEEITFDGYLMTNGQLGYDRNEKFLFGMPVPEQDRLFMLEKFREKKMTIILDDEESQFSNVVTESEKRAYGHISTPLPKVDEYRGTKLYKFVACATPDELRKLETELTGCKVTYWDAEGTDIVAKEGGKLWAIQQMMKHFGLEPSQIMAFGDGENDMEMLQYAGIGVAMGNAGEKVKQIADYVTDSVDEDGVWKALCHFGLVRDEE